LPVSLLLEILIRLPNAIAASQCKSVCKRWLSLISTPYFGLRFNNIKPSECFTLLITDPREEWLHYKKKPYPPLSPHQVIKEYKDRSVRLKLTFFPPAGIFKLAVCNDLLLCCPGFRRDYSGMYYIWNPLTSRMLDVPPSPIQSDSLRSIFRYAVGFLCDQNVDDREEYI
ncbi:hypothetical protein CFOL_v3_33274, partial [Cephalotus follicularis]